VMLSALMRSSHSYSAASSTRLAGRQTASAAHFSVVSMHARH
jgi:hypothetical protein